MGQLGELRQAKHGIIRHNYQTNLIRPLSSKISLHSLSWTTIFDGLVCSSASYYNRKIVQLFRKVFDSIKSFCVLSTYIHTILMVQFSYFFCNTNASSENQDMSPLKYASFYFSICVAVVSLSSYQLIFYVTLISFCTFIVSLSLLVFNFVPFFRICVVSSLSLCSCSFITTEMIQFCVQEEEVRNRQQS